MVAGNVRLFILGYVHNVRIFFGSHTKHLFVVNFAHTKTTRKMAGFLKLVKCAGNPLRYISILKISECTVLSNAPQIAREQDYTLSALIVRREYGNRLQDLIFTKNIFALKNALMHILGEINTMHGVVVF